MIAFYYIALFALLVAAAILAYGFRWAVDGARDAWGFDEPKRAWAFTFVASCISGIATLAAFLFSDIAGKVF